MSDIPRKFVTSDSGSEEPTSKKPRIAKEVDSDSDEWTPVPVVKVEGVRHGAALDEKAGFYRILSEEVFSEKVVRGVIKCKSCLVEIQKMHPSTLTSMKEDIDRLSEHVKHMTPSFPDNSSGRSLRHNFDEAKVVIDALAKA